MNVGCLPALQTEFWPASRGQISNQQNILSASIEIVATALFLYTTFSYSVPHLLSFSFSTSSKEA